MTTLLQHIESLNAQADQMMAQEPGLWMSHYTDDMSHWADMGIYTAADFIRWSLIESISDASKDLYGCRMRLNSDDYSIEELQDTYDSICRQLNEQFELEKEAEALAAEWKKGLPDDCEPLPYEEFADLEETA